MPGCDIEVVIRILRRETRKFRVPIVSQIAESESAQKPFLVLISCLLSLRTKDLRTKDETTASASGRLFDLAASPQEILGLSVRQIEKAIYPVGFYRVKARRIKEICRTLIDTFSSRVPDSLDELLTLKGVGRKTANLVLTEGFGKLGICVDVHVHRITNRLGLCKTKTPKETEFFLRNKLPKRYWIEYNTLLVTWGQNICKPISPLCAQCAIKRYCRRIGVTTSR